MKILDFKDKNFYSYLDEACEPAKLGYDVVEIVDEVIKQVRQNGDEALFELTKKFDGAILTKENIKVSKEELSEVKIPKEDLLAIKQAIKTVSEFNKQTKPKNWRAKNAHGGTVGENFYPIGRVGLYIPGGEVPLVSSVIMTATLAKIAGCKDICVCTPPDKNSKINPYILSALKALGISEIYKLGGAQAIAGMGIGTQSIKKVDKIYGPGNAFVIEAKRALFGQVGCDLLPGPSEVLILADSSSSPKYIAADLLSQAEHGSGKEKIFLVSTSKKIISQVEKQLLTMSKTLTRAQKLLRIIDIGTYCILTPNLEKAVEVANYIAPEHAEIQCKNPEYVIKNFTTAGALLVGENTPTVLGDFCAGPSHTLPTGRTGRFSSGLQVIDFMRRSSYVKYDKKALEKASFVVEAFGKMECLDAHANSLKVRL